VYHFRIQENIMPHRIARRLRLLAVVLSCLFIQRAFSLDTTDPKKSFIGTWQGQFQGKIFVTMKLDEQNDQLTGTISHSQIQLDNQGQLASAEPQDGEDSFTQASLAGKVLHLVSKGPSGVQTEYEMELKDTDQAELRLLGTPTGAATPKAWTLTRAQSEARPLSIKDKLTNAAHIWMTGQMGNNSAATGSTPASADSATAAAIAPVAQPALKVSDAPLDADLRKGIDALPRRVNDQFNNLGDMVNFVIVGSQEQVQNALTAASWHVADTDTRASAIRAVLETYQKKDYLTMPMSQLYLFGRVQDFGYEMAEAYAVVASRHHFRIWKAPFTWNGEPVWVGAGTHDIGFEKDQRNGKVTHKIDPAVDGERDNIGASLDKANVAKSLAYYLPPDPVQATKNATGGEYHSDGRLLVVILK
jgi:hypothetical protein